MAVSQATVLKRVTELLNACAAGTYSATVVSYNLSRNATALSDTSAEAALMIGRAIITNPEHVHRNVFVSGSPTSLTHGAELPDMAGQPSLVEIEPYTSAGFTTGQLRDVQQIESYRSNPNSLYDSIAHSTQGSLLAGFYAISNGRIYFTGLNARAYFPVLTTAGVVSLIPDEYENTWVALTMGLSIKEGDNLFPIGQYYMQHGEQDLQAITQMGVIQPLPTPTQAQAVRGNV